MTPFDSESYGLAEPKVAVNLDFTPGLFSGLAYYSIYYNKGDNHEAGMVGHSATGVPLSVTPGEAPTSGRELSRKSILFFHNYEHGCDRIRIFESRGRTEPPNHS